MNRKYGLQTSGVQFLFWFLLLICGIPQIITQTRGHDFKSASEINNHQYSLTSYLIFYVFSLLIFLLNCCADPAPLETKFPKTDKPFPKLNASFLSRIVYAWIEPLVWKGSRKPLEETDLWDVSPEESSNELVTFFLKYWNRPVARAPGYNR